MLVLMEVGVPLLLLIWIASLLIRSQKPSKKFR